MRPIGKVDLHFDDDSNLLHTIGRSFDGLDGLEHHLMSHIFVPDRTLGASAGPGRLDKAQICVDRKFEPNLRLDRVNSSGGLAEGQHGRFPKQRLERLGIAVTMATGTI